MAIFEIKAKETSRSRSRNAGEAPTETRFYRLWAEGMLEFIDLASSDIEDAVQAKMDEIIQGIGNIVNFYNETLTPNASRFEPLTESEFIFDGEIEWKLFKPRLLYQESETSFDLGTSRVRKDQSIFTVASYGTDPPDFKGGIGFNQSDRTFEGVDVEVPILVYNHRVICKTDQITTTYVAALLSAVGKVNSDVILGAASGEALFAGVSGTPRDGTEFELNFRFAMSPNATELSVGSITGISKFGWDYLWVYRVPSIDPDSNLSIQIPRSAYVERVYDPAAMAGLLTPWA